MKVTVSVGGRFHAFNLAAELARQGNLRRLITSYPAFAAARHGVPKDLVSSLWSKEIVERLWQKLPEGWKKRFDPTLATAERFDIKASRRIPEDTDIFVGWSGFSLNSIRYAKVRGIPTILDHGSAHIQYHTDILKEEHEKFGSPIDFDQRMIDKQLREYAEADYIALPSKFAVKTFVDKGIPEKKLICVPYGVNPSSFSPAPKEDDVFRVIYVGGMTLQKGVHYLLQAFAELALPNSELLLVGTMHDEMRPYIEKYPGARAIGSVPQSELHKYYSQSSVFVLDSVQDGFGMVIIQAMACGLPIIASENTGGPDIIREGEDGFIVPIRDPQALGKKIKYLYDHPEARAKMGASAAERVSQGFTWQDYGRRMMAEYQRILQRG
jgi:glycosyltransferase involved in cell wall biosynthesis